MVKVNINSNTYYKINANYQKVGDTEIWISRFCIDKKTKELLSGLYIKYCCDEQEANELLEICKENDKKIEHQYDINWKKNESISDSVADSVTDLTIVKNENIFIRFINKIKSIFKRK